MTLKFSVWLECPDCVCLMLYSSGLTKEGLASVQLHRTQRRSQIDSKFQPYLVISAARLGVLETEQSSFSPGQLHYLRRHLNPSFVCHANRLYETRVVNANLARSFLQKSALFYENRCKRLSVSATCLVPSFLDLLVDGKLALYSGSGSLPRMTSLKTHSLYAWLSLLSIECQQHASNLNTTQQDTVDTLLVGWTFLNGPRIQYLPSLF